MIWEEVIEKYGKELSEKMSKSKYLKGITLSYTPDGKVDIPESDIENAYGDVMGLPIYGWD